MRKLLLIAAMLQSIISTAQNSINAPVGTSPVIDGIISPGEWSDAATITYQAGTSPYIITVTAYIKHNNTDTLYIAQNMPDLNSGDRDLVYFDKNHNGGSYPMSDDVMLNRYHSAGGPTFTCLGNGSDWDYYSQNGWTEGITGEAWMSNQGQTEFAISFSLLGISAGVPKTMGFGISFGDWVNPFDPSVIWEWPSNTNQYSPGTWGDINILFSTNINDKTENDKISISPNPATSNIKIESCEGQVSLVEIISIEGKLIKSFSDIETKQINIENLLAGIYLLKIHTNSESVVKKLIKE